MARDAGAPQRRATPHDELTLWVEAKSARRSPRRLLRLVLSAVRLAYSASPRGVREAAALQVVTAVCAGLTVLVGQRVLSDILAVADGADVVGRAVVDVLLLAGISAVAAAAPAFQAQQQRELAEQVGRRIWDDVLAVTTAVRLESFERPEFFTMLQRVQANALLRPVTVTTALLGLVGGVAGTISVAVAVLAVAPLLLPVLLALGMPALLLSRRAARTEFAFAVDQTETVRRRSYLRTLLTSRQAAQEVRATGSGRHFRRRHDEITQRFLTAVHSQVRLRQRYAAFTVLANTVAVGLTLVVLIVLLDRGRIDVAAAGAALIGVRMLSGRLDQLVGAAVAMFESGPFLRDLDDFLALGDASGPVAEPALVTLDDRLRLESVSFAYPGAERTVLHEVDFEVRRGEIVALVGENGSGKSTLAKIVAGLYRPTAGRVVCDGVDLASLPDAGSAGYTSVVFQDFLRYQLTAGENIGIGDPERMEDEQAVVRAASAAGADDFLAGLPAAYSTMLSKEYAEGVDLSGGQWQRVALARALFRDAPLVVLDEPSSSLDARGESELFEDVRMLMRGRAALLISHRFSSVRLADRIYVLHDGRIVDHGTHDELLSRGGRYAELFALQAKSYL